VLNRFRLSTKLLGGFLLVIAIFGGSTLFSAGRTRALVGHFDTMINVSYPAQLDARKLTADIQELLSDVRGLILLGNEGTYRQARADIQTQLKNIQPLLRNGAERQAYAAMKARVDAEVAAVDRIRALAVSGDRSGAVKAIGASTAQRDAALKAVEGFIALHHQQDQAELSRDHQAASSTERLQMILAILAALVGLAFALVLSRAITRPLARLVATSGRVAEGDLTVEDLPALGRDEVADLARAFNAMLGSLRDLVGRLAGTSQQLAASSEELTASADQNAQAVQQVAQTVTQLAQGATTQSSAVSEAANTMSELKSGIEQVARGSQDQARGIGEAARTLGEASQAIQNVAQSAQDVSAAAAQTLASAQRGGEAVRKTVEGMERIHGTVLESATKVQELGAHSEQIGQIVQVISDIADQTNLLALNAAIEAARAGEHGKGFAVVADAVRQLAERSSQATKEIAGLITTIQHGTAAAVAAMQAGTHEVEQGGELAREAGRALQEILAAMERTNEQVQSISAAAQQVAASSGTVVKAMDGVAAVTEQSSAATQQMASSSEQVNGSMQQVAAVSQQTAAAAQQVSASAEEMSASTEEISASARSLAGMAQELQVLVSRFKLRGTGAAA
jgi:methyl-accepting chemotaxis protein